MILPINFETMEAIKTLPYRQNVKVAALKVYAALYLMSMRKNRMGFFPVPAEFLQAINKRYKKIINHFVSKKIIAIFERPTLDDEDIFETNYKKYYDVNRGICMKYRFLINVDKAKFKVDIPYDSKRNFRWYSIIYNSLTEYGIETKIKRCVYGRRVHHPAIYDWRERFVDLWVIDSITSQPRLLYNEMKARNIVDKEYFEIFDNDLDFYEVMVEKINLIDRDDAKSLFMNWAMGNGYSGDRIKHGVHLNNLNKTFPIVNAFIKELKKMNYKDAGSYLQRIESKIWIDDLLNNLPVDFCIPVHDSFIVKEKDVDLVLDYCKGKYPDLRFKKSIIEYDPTYQPSIEVLPEEEETTKYNNLKWNDIFNDEN